MMSDVAGPPGFGGGEGLEAYKVFSAPRRLCGKMGRSMPRIFQEARATLKGIGALLVADAAGCAVMTWAVLPSVDFQKSSWLY
jgi:hypothetical protein